MKIKLTLLSFILGILSLSAFSQIYVPGGVSTGVKSSNNSFVGVGTVSPRTAFHVEGSIFLPNGKSIWMGNNNDVGSRVRIAVGDTISSIDYYPKFYFRTGSTNSATYVMTLLSNGNVGIGTMKPTAKLHVNGNADFSNVFTNDIYFPGSDFSIIKTGPGIDMKYTRTILTAKENGNVGIGITTPLAKLHVNGNLYVQNGRLGIKTTSPLVTMQLGNLWTFYDGASDKIIGRNCYYNGSSNVRIQQGVVSRMYFGGTGDIVLQTSVSGNANSVIDGAWNTVIMKNDGSVGIGTGTTGGYKLRVNGNINCTELVVTATAGSKLEEEVWPDYVFAEDYNLRSLDEIAFYIQQNKHLPEIPSAVEVSEKGINIGAMNALLLKKVEELTLYILQQNQDIQLLKEEVNSLKERR